MRCVPVCGVFTTLNGQLNGQTPTANQRGALGALGVLCALSALRSLLSDWLLSDSVVQCGEAYTRNMVNQPHHLHNHLHTPHTHIPPTHTTHPLHPHTT